MKSIVVCINFRPFANQPSCAQRGSEALADWLEQEIATRKLAVTVDRSVCLGHCPVGPNVRLLGGAFIHEASREKLSDLLDQLAATKGSNQEPG